MEDQPSYLKFLINEDIYNIQEDSPEFEVTANTNPTIKEETYFLLDPKEYESLEETLQTLLDNIIKATGLPKELVKFPDPNEVKALEDSKFENCTFITFYDDKIDLPVDKIPTQKYQIHHHNSNTWLLSDSLETLNSSRDKKLLLWGKLKIIYKLG